MYDDAATSGPVTSIGIESQDIVGMVDQMVRDMLTSPVLARQAVPPRVVVDARYSRNESSSVINKNLITDLLRAQLNRAANGRMVFLGRHYADMTEKERALEESGAVGPGSRGPTPEAWGYDYRLGGRIASLDSVGTATGLVSRYQHLTFEMVARGSGVIVWSGVYKFRKTAEDDILYR